MPHAKTLDKSCKHLLDKVLQKDPAKRATIQDCLEHVAFKKINKQQVETGQFRPGVEPTNNKDMGTFMSNFSDDFTSLNKELDHGEYDIRALQEDEDKAFINFNWKDDNKVMEFQR